MITICATPKELETAAARAGITMLRLCEEAGIANTTWYRWLNGDTSPKLETVVTWNETLERLRNAGA